MLNAQSIRDKLLDENPDAVLFENMDEALVGYGKVGHTGPVGVYSKQKMFAKFQRDGFLVEDAEEYFYTYVNVWNPENTPVILEDLSEE